MAERRRSSFSAASGAYRIERARVADVPVVVEIIEEAARWLTSRGIRQWLPEPERTFEHMRTVISNPDREVYVVYSGDEPAATLTLQPEDRATWGDVPDDALYVHGLAVCRTFAGRRLGERLLRWAGRGARERGKTYLRLDCMAGNVALRAYYERLGFRERTDVPHDPWSTLYERRVARP